MSEKNKDHMISLTCRTFKNDTDKLIDKTEIESQMQEHYGYSRDRGTNSETGTDIYTTIYKIDN